MISKIPVKFHVEDNKLILDEFWMLLTGDKIVIDHFIDENGMIHYTNVSIERRITG